MRWNLSGKATAIILVAVVIGGAALWFAFGRQGDLKDLEGKWEGQSGESFLLLEVWPDGTFVYESHQGRISALSGGGKCRGKVEGASGGFHFDAQSALCDDFDGEIVDGGKAVAIRAGKNAPVTMQRKGLR